MCLFIIGAVLMAVAAQFAQIMGGAAWIVFFCALVAGVVLTENDVTDKFREVIQWVLQSYLDEMKKRKER